MRHLNAQRKLGRTSSHRKAMLRNMVTSLLRHGEIRTTDAKAKEVRRIADRIVTLTKRVPRSRVEAANGDERKALEAQRLHAIRLAALWVNDKEVLHNIFTTLGEGYATRNGGYTRVLKLGYRPGDNAPMSVVQLVEQARRAE